MDWDTTVSALICCNLPEDEFTSATIKRRLLAEDARRNENNGSKQQALVAKTKSSVNKRNQKQGKYSEGARNYKKNDQIKKNTQRNNLICYNCQEKGHIGRFCPEKKNAKANEDSQVVNMSARCNAVAIGSDSWIIDSGATHHMTPNESYFLTISKSVAAENITLANGRATPSTGKGTVRAKIINNNNVFSFQEFEARDTLLVPKINHGILSVRALTENKMEIIFNKEGCFIYNKDGKLVIKAEKKGQLYVVDAKPSTKAKLNLLSCQNNQAKPIDLWHRRMMHTSKTKIVEMAKTESVLGLNIEEGDLTPCDSCLTGKSTRQTFSKNQCEHDTKLKTEILELVHADLMGPVDIPSWGGSKYLLTITDDASRYIFVRFLKKKGDVLGEIKKWKVEVEKQTGQQLKRIRTDNGLEFCSKNWMDFCNSEGIRHEKTMIYTPQQNGVAERLNRTLLDLVRAGIQENNLPKNSWAELTAIAAYIRNRTTNTHNKKKTPYELWVGR